MAKLRILNLGWGVQSWTVAAMSALGELPKVIAVHADTTYEFQRTYQFAEKWTPWLESHGVRIVTVNDKEQVRKVSTYQTDIPAFTLSENGGKGQLRRQCTHRWKIAPIRRFITGELEKMVLKKRAGIVEQWLGISIDEIHRAKDSDVNYIIHRFPLLEKRMTRLDCLAWLEKNNLPSPGRSSCVFCPYHSKSAWQDLKRVNGPDWALAQTIDLQIRDARPPYLLFVHSGLMPLGKAVSIPEDVGLTQLTLWDVECDSGYCFI